MITYKCNNISYVFSKTIGQGAEGIVHQTNRFQNKIYALKQYQQEISDREKEIIQLIQSKKLKNFVKIIDHDFINKIVIMELAQCTLQQLINDASYQRFDTAEKNKLFLQIAKGVQELLQEGLMHRDLKPENILVFEKFTTKALKLSDTGFVKQIQGNNKDVFQTACVGTPKYQAPETSTQTYNEKCDIYSLGRIWYEMLTHKPFASNKKDNTRFQTQKGEVQNQIKNTLTGLDDQLEQLLIQMLENDPEIRPDIATVVYQLELSQIKYAKQMSEPKSNLNSDYQQQNQIKNLKEENQKLLEKNYQLTKDNENLNDQVSKLKLDCSNQQQQINEKCIEIEKLKAEQQNEIQIINNNYNQQISECEQKVQIQMQLIERQMKEIEHYTKETECQMNETKQLKQQLQNTTDDIQKGKKVNEELQNENNQFQEKVKQLQSQKQELINENTKLKVQFQEQFLNLTNNTLSNQDLKLQLQKLKKEIESQQKQIQEYENVIKDYNLKQQEIQNDVNLQLNNYEQLWNEMQSQNNLYNQFNIDFFKQLQQFIDQEQLDIDIDNENNFQQNLKKLKQYQQLILNKVNQYLNSKNIVEKIKNRSNNQKQLENIHQNVNVILNSIQINMKHIDIIGVNNFQYYEDIRQNLIIILEKSENEVTLLNNIIITKTAKFENYDEILEQYNKNTIKSNAELLEYFILEQENRISPLQIIQIKFHQQLICCYFVFNLLLLKLNDLKKQGSIVDQDINEVNQILEQKILIRIEQFKQRELLTIDDQNKIQNELNNLNNNYKKITSTIIQEQNNDPDFLNIIDSLTNDYELIKTIKDKFGKIIDESKLISDNEY